VRLICRDGEAQVLEAADGESERGWAVNVHPVSVRDREEVRQGCCCVFAQVVEDVHE
jgi:hypothetical protein